MTTKAATHARAVPSAVSERDRLTLAGEHTLLLHGVHRRMWPVLALIDAGAWPTAELNTLLGFLRNLLLRQVSDEEALLFAGDAATLAELTGQHARMHALTERLAQANAAHCPLPELRRVVAELANLLARHLAMEEALLASLDEKDRPVPGAAEVARGAQPWLTAEDAPLLIGLDDLPSKLAAQLCIERLLRLRPGQRAELRSSDRSALDDVYRWMQAFDTTGYGIDYNSPDASEARLRIVRRADS
jgi:Hemerythrin HHE cation binding domain